MTQNHIIYIVSNKMILYSFKIHVKVLVSCSDKVAFKFSKIIIKLVFFYFQNYVFKHINHSFSCAMAVSKVFSFPAWTITFEMTFLTARPAFFRLRRILRF